MKKISFYALCMLVALSCQFLVSCGEDNEEELAEILYPGNDDDIIQDNGDDTTVDGDEEKETDDAGDDDVNEDGTTTIYPPTDISGHEAVDLGLSVKWATCNVGATVPEEFGGFYSWGGTEEQKYYNFYSCKYIAQYDIYNTKFSKYCTDEAYGDVDNKTVLEPEDDVAHVKWGGSWRMPTVDEMQELIDNCSWAWTELNVVGGGYVITSNINGNSIFLPAAGYQYDTTIMHRWAMGEYRSSSLSDHSGSFTYGFKFYAKDYRGNEDYSIDEFQRRDYGCSVRPVTE